MSTATINGLAILSGTVTLRLVGAWDAELVVSGTDTATLQGPVELSIGGVVFVGYAQRAGADSGNRVTVRVVGGAGGLDAVVEPQGYVQATRGEVLSGLLLAGRERLSPLSDAAVTGAFLASWSRRAGTVKEALRAVVDHAGVHWRILPDGSVWVGSEVWAPLEVDHTLTSEAPSNDRLTVAVESAALQPGVTFLGHQVAGVTYKLSGRGLRAEVSFAGERDDLGAQLSAMVRRETAGRDLERTFGARVLSQNADGTLELRPSDASMPGLSRVPVRLGIPGVTGYQVTPQVECSYEYENGDPTKPFVSSFGQGQAITLTVGATSIEMGGNQSLVKHDVLAALWAQLVSACAATAPPITVPPMVGAQTLILKGG